MSTTRVPFPLVVVTNPFVVKFAILPIVGVVNVGEVPKTNAPEPVSLVTAAAKFALDGVARNVAMPVPSPLTPVEIGSPVALVSVPDEGVPSAPLNVTNAPAEPTLTPSAVRTPVPVVVVEGAAPAPPPITIALAASAAELAQVEELEKYGTPPEVPATVRARVPDAVIGEPLTEIRPPVND